MSTRSSLQKISFETKLRERGYVWLCASYLSFQIHDSNIFRFVYYRVGRNRWFRNIYGTECPRFRSLASKNENNKTDPTSAKRIRTCTCRRGIHWKRFGSGKVRSGFAFSAAIYLLTDDPRHFTKTLWRFLWWNHTQFYAWALKMYRKRCGSIRMLEDGIAKVDGCSTIRST